jgi:hypothetical protein
MGRPRHSSSGWSQTSHSGSPGSNPGLVTWDLWWRKWRWGRFSPSNSVSLANLHSSYFCTITIPYHPGLVMWDLWWTKWRWGRFSPSNSVSLANLHSTNFCTITITYHPGLIQYASSGCSTQSPTPLIIKIIIITF